MSSFEVDGESAGSLTPIDANRNPTVSYSPVCGGRTLWWGGGELGGGFSPPLGGCSAGTRWVPSKIPYISKKSKSIDRAQGLGTVTATKGPGLTKKGLAEF